MRSTPKLTVEMVPRSAWFQNLRSMLPAGRWDELRRGTYRRVGYRCEICGGVGRQHPVECHEKWAYDDERHIARLVGLFGLCPACHEAKHAGLAQIRGRLPDVVKHLAKVNGISAARARTMVREAFDQWADRSEHDWTVDISWVDHA